MKSEYSLLKEIENFVVTGDPYLDQTFFKRMRELIEADDVPDSVTFAALKKSSLACSLINPEMRIKKLVKEYFKVS